MTDPLHRMIDLMPSLVEPGGFSLVFDCPCPEDVADAVLDELEERLEYEALRDLLGYLAHSLTARSEFRDWREREAGKLPRDEAEIALRLRLPAFIECHRERCRRRAGVRRGDGWQTRRGWAMFESEGDLAEFVRAEVRRELEILSCVDPSRTYPEVERVMEDEETGWARGEGFDRRRDGARSR